MPFHPAKPIIRVEADSIHAIDTGNVENLFGLWSVFSKCAETMEEGKRFENLSWRLWNRETFCCGKTCSSPQRWKPLTRRTFDECDSPTIMPQLSSSVESDASLNKEGATSTARATAALIPARPELRRQLTEESHNTGSEKHVTPSELEKMVVSIKANKSLEKLPPLPQALTPHRPAHLLSSSPATSPQHRRGEDTTPRPSSPPPAMVPESSTSTVATTHTASTDFSCEMSPPLGSDTSTSTEMSSHSIVHGFQLGRISSSIRSSSNLAPTPTPILKTSPAMKAAMSRPQTSAKRKQVKATFTLGGSSGEGDESSLEIRYGKTSSNLSDSLKKQAKTTSFKEEISTRAYESEEVFESDSEEGESESAIEEDDDDDVDWEDEEEQSGPSSVNEHEMFKRVDSRPNLTSRRSLLTQAMHEPDRATALQNLASRSSPAIRRSRTSTPNGPSLAASPKEGAEFEMPGANPLRAKPIIVTSNVNGIPIVPMSPRTTRRNMLSSEMTESLRKHLLWERQQKNSTASAHLKRRHTSNDIKNLKHYPNENIANLPSRLPPIDDHKAANSYSNHHFDNGLLEYHTKGW